jgi:hypothetical protein
LSFICAGIPNLRKEAVKRARMENMISPSMRRTVMRLVTFL